jgi:hypothetical protein
MKLLDIAGFLSTVRYPIQHSFSETGFFPFSGDGAETPTLRGLS